MYAKGGAPTILQCTFRGNTCRYGGAGMYFRYSTAVVTGCTIRDNVTTLERPCDGGGIRVGTTGDVELHIR